MTLNAVIALILHFFTERDSFLGRLYHSFFTEFDRFSDHYITVVEDSPAERSLCDS